MKFEKLGKVCDVNSLNLPWLKTNIMTPLPIFKGNRIRVFLTFCDELNRGRIGYVDLNKDNPLEILGYSKEPCLDLGERGMFDEDGVLTASSFEEDGKMYLYYSAYQKQCTLPYTIFTGLAVSSDGGEHFERVQRVPVLDRTDDEAFMRAAVEVMKTGDKYRIWYAGGGTWFDRGDKLAPEYGLKYMETNNPAVFPNAPVSALELEDDEYGLAMPQVWQEDGIYKMIYSIRSRSKGYRVAYAESEDGITFKRVTNMIDGLDVSKDGFDSEMICFGKIVRTDKETYMFYCGNHYGREGLGVAKMMD